MREKRLFVSVELPSSIKQEVVRLSNLIGSEPWFAGRVVPQHQLHCTVVFLGLIAQSRISSIVDRLNSIAFVPIPMKLGKLAFFERKSSLVLYVQVISLQLVLLAEQVRCALADLCPQESRTYTGHVTLARMDILQDFVHTFIAKTSVTSASGIARTLYLNESTSTPQGHMHIKLATINAHEN